jgi:ferrochelatase
MSSAVLLVAHGAPERLEDIGEYLGLVRGGRPVAAKVIDEVTHRYQLIGGSSPLLVRTREQAAALESLLDGRAEVFIAMRNWSPFIKETLARMQTSGIERIVAVCLAPQYSELSVGLYMRRIEQALAELDYSPALGWTRSFHDHPLLIDAFAQRLAPLLDGAHVLFTAHSLPEKVLESGDPYDSEARTTARLVAEHCGISNWDFAYQSQGMTAEPWLGPTVESRIDYYAAAGIRELILAPIGFVSDHVEILYDVDILFRDYAAARGMRIRRPESLNDHPVFIRALRAVASAGLGIATASE